MNTEFISPFLHALGRLSAQAGVLVLLVLIAQWVCRDRLSPRWRCALWFLVVTRLLLPASLPTPLSIFNLLPVKRMAGAEATSPLAQAQTRAEIGTSDFDKHQASAAAPFQSKTEVPELNAPAAAVVEVRAAQAPASGPSLTTERKPGIAWPVTLFAAWLAGASALILYVAVASILLSRRFRGVPEVRTPEVLQVLDECRAMMRVKMRLRLIEVDGVLSPALHGVFRPRLLLPLGFTSVFSKDDLHFVFLHELAHVKRGDVQMNWLVALLQIIHWFNPLLWIGFMRWRTDRELACDALVLERSGPGRNRDYGRTILRLLEGVTRQVAAPGLVGILEEKKQLQQRMMMIAGFVPAKRFSILAALVVFAVGLFGLTDAQTPKPASAPQANSLDKAAAPLELAPSPASTQAIQPSLFRFTVVDAESGRPLPKTKLIVGYFFSGSDMERRELDTDESGTALIPDYEVKDKTKRGINVFVTPEGHVPKVVSWPNRDEIPRVYTMRMARSTQVGGVVKDETGQLVAGVKVNLDRPGIKDHTEQEHIDFHPRATAVITDAEGRWSFHYIPMEFESVAILMQHPDFAVTRGTVPVLKAESTNAVLVIERGVTIEGHVTGPDGQGVVKAEINELHNYGYDPRTTVSAPDGSYTLKGIKKGEIKLVVQATGLAPQMRTLNETNTLARVNFALSPGKSFRGRVVDRESRPIVGAVAQTDWDNQGLRKIAWKTKTDAAGRFEWDSAPDEPLLFWFEADGFGWKRSMLLRAGEAEHEIVLERAEIQSPPVRVFGRVLDEATQEPLPAFKVSLGEIIHSEFQPDYRAGTKGKDGNFSMTINTPCPFPSYVLLVEAEGYLPTKSQLQATKDGNKELNFVLKKGSGLAGIVRLPDGRPAASAMLYYCTLREGVYMDKPGEARDGPTSARRLRADEQGRFTLPVVADGHSLIVLNDEGFAELKVEELAKSGNVTLSPWGRVEGHLFTGRKPATNETITLQTMLYRYGDGVRSFAALSLWLTVQTDAEGMFVFDKVPPGERKIVHRLSFREGKPGPIPESHGFPLLVQPGQTTRVTLGGMGRSVIGRVVAPEEIVPIDWLRDVHRIALRLPDPSEHPLPSRDDLADEKAFVEALKQRSMRHKAFWTSEEGRALERAQRTYVPVFSADGSFRADDLPAGIYELVIKPTRSEDASLGPSSLFDDSKSIGVLTNRFTIPEMPTGRNDEPLDLGVLALKATKAAKTLKVGQPAPLFDIKTLSGRPLRLADYRGRFVLLDFWATWCRPCLAELPYLKETYEAFHGDERLVMLGLSLDAGTNAPIQFARTNQMTWTQGFLGDWSKTSIPSDYAVVGIPALFLVGPDGNVIAKDLRGTTVKSVVAQALKK